MGVALVTDSVSRSAPLENGRPAQNAAGQYVVLLHGLGRTALSMKMLEWTLAKEGYQVINVSYPSTRLSMENASDDWLANLLQNRIPRDASRIHFVTHSQGGIVLRYFLMTHRLENPGRVVMLAPPNQGSELSDRFEGNYLYRFFTGPAGQQLGTGPEGLPRRLPAPGLEVGIIAGDRSLNPLFSACIPGANDGKVSVRNTRLEGMKDFLIVHHSHTWIICRSDVVAAVSRFLKNGNFADSLPSQ